MEAEREGKREDDTYVHLRCLCSVYTMQLMLECKKKIGTTLSPEQARSLTYTELGKIALGWFGKWSVNIAVLCCNLGVCAGYMIFISSNLQVRII